MRRSLQTKRQSSKENLNPSYHISRKSAAMIQITPKNQKYNPQITIEVGLVGSNEPMICHQKTRSTKSFKTDGSILEQSDMNINTSKQLSHKLRDVIARKQYYTRQDSDLKYKGLLALSQFLQLDQETDKYDTVNYQLSPIKNNTQQDQEEKFYETIVNNVAQQLMKLSLEKTVSKGAISELHQSIQQQLIQKQKQQEDYYQKYQAQNQLVQQLDKQLQEYKKLLAQNQKELIVQIQLKQQYESQLLKMKQYYSDQNQIMNNYSFNSQIEEQNVIILQLKEELNELKNKCLSYKQQFEDNKKSNCQNCEMKNLSLRNEIARLEREIELQRKKNDGNERIFRQELEYWKQKSQLINE